MSALELFFDHLYHFSQKDTISSPKARNEGLSEGRWANTIDRRFQYRFLVSLSQILEINFPGLMRTRKRPIGASYTSRISFVAEGT